VRIFVSEYVCGGGWPSETIGGSLAVEGRAMLCAVVDDLSRIAGVEVETTWDARLGRSPFSRAQTTQTESPADELRHFRRLAAACDATLVIAPEFDGTLLSRCRIVEEAGGRLLGPGSRAVALCTDKLRLAVHLREAGIETIPAENFTWDDTRPNSPADGPREFPVVIKPRDGAGSQNTWLVKSADEFIRLRTEFAGDLPRGEFVAQPYVGGQAASVALLFAPSQQEVEILVPAEQRISGDGRFRYLGGRLPLRKADSAALQRTALAACRSIPGLRGYVGVDLIVPSAEPGRPIVVEINPRLTTSYLGYRALAESNLAEWMLIQGRFERGIRWRKGAIEFDSAGNVLPKDANA
jgi:predicted ATP-grasp superfamily ATP-dependent carboligase